MNCGHLSPLISGFALNWDERQPHLNVLIHGNDINIDTEHPLYGELFSLCSGGGASLPYFLNHQSVQWCTIAPDAYSLRKTVTDLGAWILPSFGGILPGDGYITPVLARGHFAHLILTASPDGYYKWNCPLSKFESVLSKLKLFRSLEAVRPERTKPHRPSLYEFRARFVSALLVGDRHGAESIIGLLDQFQLETAVNTQFMRIRMWHSFAEFDLIRNHPDLPQLLAQPLPPRVRAWITEACGVSVIPTSPQSDTVVHSNASQPLSSDSAIVSSQDAAENTDIPAVGSHLLTWIDWVDLVKDGNRSAADLFIQDRSDDASLDVSSTFIDSLAEKLGEFYVDDALRARERNLILQGVSELLDEYVRESEFPRDALSKLYLALFQLWGALHSGNTAGKEHGHVLLELANALLQLNESAEDVCIVIENWWKAKPTSSQLHFVLDAIELMERELSDKKRAENLWVSSADVIKRKPDSLLPSDRELWRRVGSRIGFDANTVAEYLPPEPPDGPSVDMLAEAGLKHIAVVCLREQQAKQAAEEIRERCGSKVTVVTDTAAGAQTTQACTADVVLFVWLASTHAVFRAFDGYDRQKFCYVQGTGASSIVRSLERWFISRS
jgi:hypothetical protein